MKWKMKRLRQAAALLLGAVLIINLFAPILLKAQDEVWDGRTMTEPARDEEGTYLITSGEELYWFANYVNEGHGGADARLEASITLNDHQSDHAWTMIGKSETRPFRGSFDGNGRQIKNLSAGISNANVSMHYAGLFGVIDGGSVRNLTVTGSVTHAYAGTGYSELYTGAGAICGYLKSGRITGCTSYAEITMSGDCLYRNVGGIVGVCKGLVMNCTNYGRISTDEPIAQRHLGGVAGVLYGAGAQGYGLVNRGYVGGYFEVGGVAGAVKNGAELLNSCNYGILAANDYLGGVVGLITGTGTYADGTAKESVVRNVYNYYPMTDTTAGVCGGIAAMMGYENWTDQASPAMPILENAYSMAGFSDDLKTSRGSIVGYFRSGQMGNVYGPSETGLPVVGHKEGDNAVYTGPALSKTGAEMKTTSFARALGSDFVKTGIYDENAGYPKLAWQSRSDSLNEKAEAAMLEVNGWRNEENRRHYGANYKDVEALAALTLEKLGSVTTEEALDELMAEARALLAAIETSGETDQALYEAIDEAMLELSDYTETLLEEESLQTDEAFALEELLDTYLSKLQRAATVSEAETLLSEGKEAIRVQAESFLAAKRLEEIRANAIVSLETYLSGQSFGEPYDSRLDTLREEGLAGIRAAESAEQIARILGDSKKAMEEVIAEIPSEGAWDGVTKEEPKLQSGIYQIENGAQLAWLSDFINEGNTGTAVLSADIDLGNQEFSPIGSGDTPFRGSFDGQGHEIRGLKITQATTYAGLFARVYGDADQVIKNVTVSGQIHVTRTAAYAGGVAAYIYGENENARNSIVNCHSKVKVVLDQVITEGSSAGGIAGYAKYSWIRECSATGQVAIPSEGKGGIRYYAGGILGLAGLNVSIRQSFYDGAVSSGFAAGGIIGRAEDQTFAATSNYAEGSVDGAMYAGGIAGWLSAAGQTVSWSYTDAQVNAASSGKNMGALFGQCSSGTFDNLYALRIDSLAGRALVGAAGGETIPGAFVTESELSGNDLLAALNGGGAYFTYDHLGFHRGFPLLSWQYSLEELKNAAIAALERAYPADLYSEESGALVISLLEEARDQIQNAADAAQIGGIQQAAREALSQIPTLREEQAVLLGEAKDAALLTLDAYKNPEDYGEEEQKKLESYKTIYRRQIEQADSREKVESLLAKALSDMDLLPTLAATKEERNLLAARSVDAMIMDIGPVAYTEYTKNAIEAARAAFDALTDEQRLLVNYEETLVEAEAAYKLLEEQGGEPEPEKPTEPEKPVEPTPEQPEKPAEPDPFTPVRPTRPVGGDEHVPVIHGNGGTRPIENSAQTDDQSGVRTPEGDQVVHADTSERPEGQAEILPDTGGDKKQESIVEAGAMGEMEKQLEEALLRAQKITRQKNVIKLLGAILVVLVILALLMLLAMSRADKKRKERQVHFE